MTTHYQKKIALGVHARRTRWAPIWVLVRKFGQSGAKYHHVSEITKHKRHWKQTKLKLKPRRATKKHLG